jgi:hypothetical protein
MQHNSKVIFLQTFFTSTYQPPPPPPDMYVRYAEKKRTLLLTSQLVILWKTSAVTSIAKSNTVQSAIIVLDNLLNTDKSTSHFQTIFLACIT